MAPTKVKTGSTRGNNKRSSKASSRESSSKAKRKASNSSSTSALKSKKPTPSHTRQKKGRRWYAENELNVPKLNMITPAGIQKPKGKKKGKVLVDDQESMMTILAMVNADKEGQIESKMMKARQMEEIRQARQREMEAKAEEKKDVLNKTKESLRRSRKKKGQQERRDYPDPSTAEQADSTKPKKKQVSFRD